MGLQAKGSREISRQKRDTLNSSCPDTHSVPTTAGTSAGEAGNDDIEYVHEPVDDGFDGCGNTVDDGHKATTDGAEDVLDLGGD